MTRWLFFLCAALQIWAMGAHASEMPEVLLGATREETMLLSSLNVVVQPEQVNEDWSPEKAWQEAAGGRVISLASQPKP